MATVTIDFSQTQGPIKPLNGVNSGPRTKVFTYDATDLYREAHIAYSRMHDVEYPYGSGEFVDIHCIFPNFDADVNDPASYKFALTDRYIQAAREAGAGILYRLGESIEHAPVVQYVLPPKDFQKWAEICEHIIRHYNEGWADGFHWDIAYWEIWNEADLDELAPKKKTWGGTKEAFFDLYAITATHLKKCFPALKIGGPALAYNLTWADEFLTALQNRQIPLDFFSWHSYTWSPESYAQKAQALQSLLAKHGYSQAEIILDEWNYVESWGRQARSFRKLVGPTGAAFCGAVLTTLQHSPTTLATYFESDVVKEWCGLWEVKDMVVGGLSHGEKCTLKPRKPFYAFKAFGALRAIGQEAVSAADGEGIYICAAAGNECAAMLVTYRSDLMGSRRDLLLRGLPEQGCRIEVFLTDEGCDEGLELAVDCSHTEFTLPLTLSDEQIRLIRIKSREHQK